jgi:opacity protein-like surface antigen
MIMTNTKTLMLAAIAALSLGAAAANAQSLTPSAGEAAQFNARPAQPQVSVGKAQVQSGSSDMDRPGTATFILENHLYGAGGVSG